MNRFRNDAVIARSAPFLLFVAFLVLGSIASSAAAGQAMGGNASWLVVARGAAVALTLAWFWRAYAELRSPVPSRPAYWVLAIAAGLAVFLAWVLFDKDWAVLSRSPGFTPLGPDGGVDWPKALLRLAGFTLVVPVMEELFWRSLVLRWIERHEFLSVDPGRVGVRAFAISAVLFAVEHERWFAGAVAGVVYNTLYMRSRNLWVPILAHVVTNGTLGAWVLYTGNWHFW
jgi:CAAX prenyl protease-like protein